MALAKNYNHNQDINQTHHLLFININHKIWCAIKNLWLLMLVIARLPHSKEARIRKMISLVLSFRLMIAIDNKSLLPTSVSVTAIIISNHRIRLRVIVLITHLIRDQELQERSFLINSLRVAWGEVWVLRILD